MAIRVRGSFIEYIFPIGDLCCVVGTPEDLRSDACTLRRWYKDGTSRAPDSRRTHKNTFMSEFDTRILGRLSSVSSKNIYVNIVSISVFLVYENLRKHYLTIFDSYGAQASDTLGWPGWSCISLLSKSSTEGGSIFIQICVILEVNSKNSKHTYMHSATIHLECPLAQVHQVAVHHLLDLLPV